jgi:hypothetical protein
VAEGGGLLNRCRVKSSTGGSNPPLSAIDLAKLLKTKVKTIESSILLRLDDRVRRS